MALIIGVNGRMRAGKDTFTQLMVEETQGKAVRIAFADKLKRIGAACLGLSTEELERIKTSSTLWKFDNPANGRAATREDSFSFTTREFLQRLGTEGMRDNMGDNVWVEAAFKDIDMNSDNIYVISDARFPNEAQAVKEKGGIMVRIRRDEAEASESNHASEQDLSEFVDYDIDNNGTVEQLRDNVRVFITDVLQPA